MIFRLENNWRVLVLLVISAQCFPALAQNPFGQAQPDVNAQPAAPAPQPAVAAPAAPAPPKQVEPPPDPEQFSLPIRAILESNPQTPPDLVRAASVLIDFEQPALAKPYVLKLSQMQLDALALSELVARVGSGPLFKIAGQKALQPEGREFADRALAAAAERARDPAQLAVLVKQLSDPSPEAQRQAIVDLLSAHEYAVPPLLAALNGPEDINLRRRIQQVLVALRQDAVGPLLAALAGPDSAAKAVAIAALGQIPASEATSRLVGLYASPKTSPLIRDAARTALHDLHDKAPSRDEARRYLEAEIHEILAGNRLPANPDGEIELWQWDRTQGLAVPVTMPASRARAELANQLADRLLELSPNHRPYRQLYLMTLLEAEAYRVGRDKSLPRGERTAFDLAAKTGPTAVEDALSYALASGRGAAAAAAAQVLGEIAGASMLTGTAQPAPLAQALTSGDARVRFAAAQAIVHVKPTTSFPGLSHLKSELVSIARWSGQPHALVGFPNSETVQEIAGLVNAVGFESDTATNGHDLTIMAVQPRRYDLIVVSSRMDRGPLYLILQDLRNHPTTAQTPIIVLAEDDELGTLRDRWRDDPLTTVVFRPRELDGMNNAVQQSQRRASDLIVPLSVRGQHAAEALRMMSELNDLAPKLFNFRDREDAILPLLYLPTLGPLAADVASDFGTHASQQALLAIVNRASQPLASRQAAATAFAESVRDFGVRLTKDEIVSQYRRYNESEFDEAASQALLGAVLDAIELPTRVSRK